MKITKASHYGMCFGVRDALRDTHALANERPVTVLGDLVHNPLVQDHLATLGVRNGVLDSERAEAETDAVIITAHGAAESAKSRWKTAGHEVFDTTCPLVKKAHRSLECLVLAGFHPVVIGSEGHVEVRGLVTDFPEATVIPCDPTLAEVTLPVVLEKIGVISQTTQPIDRVEETVEAIRERYPEAEVRFVDTVCQPTKQRQTALTDLCAANDTIVVVGGNHSNNTAQLSKTAQALGCVVHQVESAEALKPRWFRNAISVGVTAGTSTLDETVDEVVLRLKRIEKERETLSIFDALKAIA